MGRLRTVVAALLMAVAPLLVAQERHSEALRQQVEQLNRDNAALDAQNEELRRRIAALEQQTRELTPLALQPQPMPARKEYLGYYGLAALVVALLAGVVGWRFIVARRRRA
ncbi:MAG TPA: hypothetical protein VGE50_07090 [Gammaproteobacteria bacterium]